jgi:hypothetical protein
MTSQSVIVTLHGHDRIFQLIRLNWRAPTIEYANCGLPELGADNQAIAGRRTARTRQTGHNAKTDIA